MSKRLVSLDTETTGLSVEEGHRLIEIACVELTDEPRIWQRRLNPDREVEIQATMVHGLRWDDLKDEARFADVADEFLAFIEDAELIIHNSAFDLGFIDGELKRAKRDLRIKDMCRIHDTTQIARERFPGAPVSLDALCRRFNIDNSMRDTHSAALDAQLLAKVWTALNSRQHEIGLDAEPEALAEEAEVATRTDLKITTLKPNEAELAAHQARLAAIDASASEGCLWLKLEAEKK